MSGLMLCKAQSDVPYYIKEIGKNIYSIEELSYYLYNHLYLVDEDFFDDTLIDYIEKTLENSKVAFGLRQAIEHGATLSELVSFVIKTSGYYNAAEIQSFQKQLDLLRTSSTTERQKAKADILMSHKKYSMALDIYNKIIAHPEPDVSSYFYGNVYNNIGVIYANMFDFEEARSIFSRAFKINHDTLTLKHLIYSEIMCDDDLEKTLERYSISGEMIENCKREIATIKNDDMHMYHDNLSLEKCVDKIKQEYETQFLL